MTVFYLVLVFVLGGAVQTDVRKFKTLEECVAAGQAAIVEQTTDPRFQGGLFADCVPVERIEVSLEK